MNECQVLSCGHSVHSIRPRRIRQRPGQALLAHRPTSMEQPNHPTATRPKASRVSHGPCLAHSVTPFSRLRSVRRRILQTRVTAHISHTHTRTRTSDVSPVGVLSIELRVAREDTGMYIGCCTASARGISLVRTSATLFLPEPRLHLRGRWPARPMMRRPRRGEQRPATRGRRR